MRLVRRRLAWLFAGSVSATGERRSQIESETTLKKRRYYITDAVAWNVTGAQFMRRITISHGRSAWVLWTGGGFRAFGGGDCEKQIPRSARDDNVWRRSG